MTVEDIAFRIGRLSRERVKLLNNMPLPLAHALVGASVAAALCPASQSRQWKPILIGAFLGICPDFDYALNVMRISGGGWHHGFTHSIAFALFLGLLTVVVLREWKVRSFILFSAAAASHTLLII